MLSNPSTKYKSFTPIHLPDRTWPQNTLTTAPVWLSTDLRDGNQALIEPMNIDQKLRLFQTLVDIGFKEIEIGFPAASQTEFDFARHLIQSNLIPEDVTIQALTPARESLIRRTFDALQGAKSAIVHVYSATAPTFRQVVFNLDKSGTLQLATNAATLIKEIAATQPQTNWRFQYSPEVFTSTELPFAKEVCNAVLNIWQPTSEAKAVISLTASVEVSTPNIFADQVEWMHRNLIYRDAVMLCVHPHNDRGCSVAAAELGQLAGAQRVEGCLFGNGERTGNVDLVTLAMNLYTQGISPGLDFSRLDEVISVTQACTQLTVHPRHPYAGELVFTAFSGSHQDAIKKGFAARQTQDIWNVPYLPMDPAEVGRSYESIVRVNSQSGKGGVAFLLEQDYGLSIPRKLQIEFSRLVQKAIEVSGKEVTSAYLWEIFCQEYSCSETPLCYLSHQSTQLSNAQVSMVVSLCDRTNNNNASLEITGKGTGPIDAFINALNTAQMTVPYLGNIRDVLISSYEEKLLVTPSHQPTNQAASLQKEQAIALIELSTSQGSQFGIGIHENIVIASFQAIISALNRLTSVNTTRQYQESIN